MRKVAQFVLAMTVLASCMKEEIPIEPRPRPGGDTGIDTSGNDTADFNTSLQFSIVDMGNGYPNQLYFSLNDNEVVSLIGREEWDIAFKNDAETGLVVLNNAQAMSGWKSNYNSLESAIDSTGYGLGKKIEVAAELYDDPVLGDLSGVYLIDLGFSEFGLPLGAYWIEFPEINPNGYEIRYKKYGQTNIVERLITKNVDTEFVLYSIKNDLILQEPPSGDWDLKFTRYISILTGDNFEIPYSVTGVILNSYQTSATEFSSKPFGEIDLSDAQSIDLSSAPDVIGFDWKNFELTDGTSGTYTVETDRSYIIKNSLGLYYKLRFLGFYGEGGYSGEPSFEYQLLL
ncbi:MAG: hypothetical protein MK086_06735 [Flavobacteriales bacterium]|nr:hypothetical protein [Flavobacteriales bacterium]